MLAVACATGRQVKGDDPDKKGYPGPPGWGFGVGLTTPPSKKTYCFESRAKGKAGQMKSWRRWRELVADRKKWKDIVRQAKVHSGL